MVWAKPIEFDLDQLLNGDQLAPWQTMVFTSLAVLQLGNAMAVRSERRSAFRIGLLSNPFLLYTVAATLVIQLALPYIPAARTMLTLEPLSIGELAVVVSASSGAFWAIEVEKLVLARRSPRS